jgi:hypothetical protein
MGNPDSGFAPSRREILTTIAEIAAPLSAYVVSRNKQVSPAMLSHFGIPKAGKYSQFLTRAQRQLPHHALEQRVEFGMRKAQLGQ